MSCGIESRVVQGGYHAGRPVSREIRAARLFAYSSSVPEGFQLVDCSFCDRPNREVHIVAGRDGLHICSVCVEKCADILDTDAGVPSPPGGWAGRWPHKNI